MSVNHIGRLLAMGMANRPSPGRAAFLALVNLLHKRDCQKDRSPEKEHGSAESADLETGVSFPSTAINRTVSKKRTFY